MTGHSKQVIRHGRHCRDARHSPALWGS